MPPDAAPVEAVRPKHQIVADVGPAPAVQQVVLAVASVAVGPARQPAGALAADANIGRLASIVEASQLVAAEGLTAGKLPRPKPAPRRPA